GGIRSFTEQLEVSADGTTWGFTASLTFTSGNWNVPRTIYVRAFDDTRVDGNEAQVFAPQLDQLNSIQGPLFITGGEGPDRTGLLEREPVTLPYEINEKQATGDVVAAADAVGALPATITINPNDISQAELDALNDQPNASVHIGSPADLLANPELLTNV